MEVRREKRLAQEIPVQIRGLDRDGNRFVIDTCTINISQRGARLHFLPYPKIAGESIEVQRGQEKSSFRVVWIGRIGTPQDCEIGICCLEAARHFWGDYLPPLRRIPKSAEEGVAAPRVSFAPPPTDEEGKGGSHAVPVDKRLPYAVVILGVILAISVGLVFYHYNTEREDAPKMQGTSPQANNTEKSPVPPRIEPQTQPGFSVQIGAFESRTAAEALGKKFSLRYQRKALVTPVEAQGKTLYRVRFATRTKADADALTARLQQEQKLAAWIVKSE